MPGVVLMFCMILIHKYSGDEMPGAPGFAGLPGDFSGFSLSMLWNAVPNWFENRSGSFVLRYKIAWASLLLACFAELQQVGCHGRHTFPPLTQI